MIIRLLGEGQFDVDDADVDELNTLDSALQHTADVDDAEAFGAALRRLVGRVRELGSPVPDDALAASELVLPAEDADLETVRALLGDEGLIPG